MRTRSRRVHVVLDRPTRAMVKRLARKHGSTLSQEAHDLIREAVELHGDRAVDELAERRRATWDLAAALTAAEVRAKLEGR